MSYMGLFWETGMPAAWALSRKYDDGPRADLAVGGRPDLNPMAPLWPRNMPDIVTNPVIPGQPAVMPGDIVGRPAPEPNGEETKD